MNLQKLKDNLPEGYRKTVSEELGISESTVYNMVNGDVKMKTRVAKCLLRLAKQHADEIKAIDDEINSLPE